MIGRITGIALATLATLGGVADADADETVATLALALHGHRVDRAIQLLAPSVELGPLWFPDATCAKLAKPQTVTGAQRDALASCLDGLEASSSTSVHHAGGSGVILFRSGLALGVTVKDRQVTRIGFVDTDRTDAAIPTVFRLASTIAARLTPPGDLVRAIDARIDHRAMVTYKTCIDATGKIVKTRLLAASGITGFDVLARETIAQYTFEPVEIAGKPTAVCEVIRFEHDTRPTAPPPQATRPQNVPPSVLEGLRIAGTRWIAPDAATKQLIAKSGKDKVIGVWKLCIDDQGAFSSSTILKSTGFPTYDATIGRELAKWAYKPYTINATTAPVCTAATIIYPEPSANPPPR